MTESFRQDGQFKHKSLQNCVWQKARQPANNREDVIVQSDMMSLTECVVKEGSSSTGHYVNNSVAFRIEMKIYALQNTKGGK